MRYDENRLKLSEKKCMKNSIKKAKNEYHKQTGITIIALVVTIIVLLILAGVTIAASNQGIINKAKTAMRAYKNASENEQAVLNEVAKEIAKRKPKEGTEGGSGNETGSVNITYTDSAGKTQPLTKGTPAGTKIGTTANIDGRTLDWYLFDVSDDGKTAYLVSTPTPWVPDTTKEVSGAWVPKLGGSYDITGAMRQAIQKMKPRLEYEACYDYTYASNSVTYTPSANTLNYFKSVNSDWAKSENGRSTKKFSEWNENEQAACYLADADIFAGIKDQVNKADGNLKGKIQTLVGGASVEQWCKAYNKQSAATGHKITAVCRKDNVLGYIYQVNDKQSTVSNSDYYTGDETIVGSGIYGATGNFFRGHWWLASPGELNCRVCLVNGDDYELGQVIPYVANCGLSLFASVSL